MKQEEKKGYGKMIVILAAILVVSMMISFVLKAGDSNEIIDYNTALIKVSGPIYTGGGGGLFDDTTSSEDVVRLLEKASKDSKVKAVILEINSPGGAPVATDEISEAVKSLGDENITSVAWIRETGASGAYWIASSADHIIANRMSIHSLYFLAFIN